jgi:hypothetical protein
MCLQNTLESQMQKSGSPKDGMFFCAICSLHHGYITYSISFRAFNSPVGQVALTGLF